MDCKFLVWPGLFFNLYIIAVRLNFWKNAGDRYALLLSLLLCTVTISRFAILRRWAFIGFTRPLPPSRVQKKQKQNILKNICITMYVVRTQKCTSRIFQKIYLRCSKYILNSAYWPTTQAGTARGRASACIRKGIIDPVHNRTAAAGWSQRGIDRGFWSPVASHTGGFLFLNHK